MRRLAPVPIADPLFTERPYSSGAQPGNHPDSNGTAKYAMELSVEGGIRRPGFRNVYWPGGAAGVLHFRFKGGTLVSPPNHTAPLTLEVGYVTNSDVTNGVVCDPAHCNTTVCDPNPPGSGQCLDRKIKNLAVTVFHFSSSDGWQVGELPFVGESGKYFLPLMLSLAGSTTQLATSQALHARIWVDRIAALPPGVQPSWKLTD